MTTVVNIEDTMPYVEVEAPVTTASIYADMITEVAEDYKDQADYYRSQRKWDHARVDQDTSTVLTKIAKAKDPAMEMESVLSNLSRQYMDIKAARDEADSAVRRHIRKTEVVRTAKTPTWDGRKPETSDELLARLDKIKAERDAAADKIRQGKGPVKGPKALTRGPGGSKR